MSICYPHAILLCSRHSWMNRKVATYNDRYPLSRQFLATNDHLLWSLFCYICIHFWPSPFSLFIFHFPLIFTFPFYLLPIPFLLFFYNFPLQSVSRSSICHCLGPIIMSQGLGGLKVSTSLRNDFFGGEHYFKRWWQTKWKSVHFCK